MTSRSIRLATTSISPAACPYRTAASRSSLAMHHAMARRLSSGIASGSVRDKFAPEELAEQMVIAEPLAPMVERDHETVRALDRPEETRRTAGLQHGVAQRHHSLARVSRYEPGIAPRPPRGARGPRRGSNLRCSGHRPRSARRFEEPPPRRGSKARPDRGRQAIPPFAPSVRRYRDGQARRRRPR